MLQSKQRSFLAILLTFFAVYYLYIYMKIDDPIKSSVEANVEDKRNNNLCSTKKAKFWNKYYDKSWDFKINKTYALVFFGRKKQVQILMRYLEINVKANGGVLEKIVFAVKTDNKEDLDYMDSIMAQNKSYFERINFNASVPYVDMYRKIDDDDLVFKIDDDVVFIANCTFERMIDEYITNGHLFLSANVVNHPILSNVHAKMRAVLPFYETEKFKWVRYTNATELEDTVASNIEAPGFWWKCGKCAAMVHESLIEHVETDSLDTYDFNLYDFHSATYVNRWSINFVLMRGKYVNQMKDLHVTDEVVIGIHIPRSLKRHCHALGSTVVAHFSYFTQIEYLKQTDLLDKYDKLSFKYLNKI